MRLFLLALVALISCCPAQWPASRAETLRLETVLLLSEDFGCAGTWIGDDVILTARHCVADGLEYRTFDGKSGKIYETDEDPDADVGLLFTHSSEPHPYARLSHDRPKLDQHLRIVGHPDLVTWTLTEGNVAREERDGDVQVSAPVWFGNSGGAAFDDSGRIVGVSSELVTDSTALNFFVPAGEVRRWLSARRER